MKPTDNLTKEVCDAARKYVDQGWSCFPLSLDRRPLARWKQFQTEHVLHDTIDGWQDNGAPVHDSSGNEVARDSIFNIGIVTGAISGIVVVDCDNEAAVAYAKSKGLTSPVAVKTSRGMHFYFKHPNNGRRYRNKVGNNPGSDWHAVDGLDFRGDGGFVVAPPSVSLFADGTLKHKYSWISAVDIDDMPVWRGSADDVEIVGDFDLPKLDLSTARITESISDVREQLERHVTMIGRKLMGPDCGDATDNWMIKYCGQMVRRGLQGKELSDAVLDFFNTYFDYRGTAAEAERWLKAKIRSAIEMDRRNHPLEYDATGKRLEKEATPAIDDDGEEKPGIFYATSKDFANILKSLGDVTYHADPLLPARSIVQVVGYNGHGKSLFTLAMMTAVGAGCSSFGPYHIPRPAKIAYLDFDNPAFTWVKRAIEFEGMFGSSLDNLSMWSPTIDGSDMNLRTSAGLGNLQRFLDATKPDIVVFDTVRNAFPGMDERLPQDWVAVNTVLKLVRDKYKATVVVVHHRNKPGEHGLGSEAGSTAQQTDLDLQIYITKVFKKKDVAKANAGLADEDINIERYGNTYTPYTYLEEKVHTTLPNPTNVRIKSMVEVSFRKTRVPTDLHQTQYIGWTNNLMTGDKAIVWTPSKREDAIFFASRGKSPEAIAYETDVPVEIIRKWVMP